MTKKTTFLVVSAISFSIAAFAALPAYSQAAVFERQMQIGMSGADISALQSFLAQDKSVYPQGIVTGYFGQLTRTAVANFQSRNNISPVGRVGPITLAVLNAQYSGITLIDSGTAPIIMNQGVVTHRNSAIVNWMTNEPAKGVVYYSTSPLDIQETFHAVTVSGNAITTDTALRTTQSVSIMNLDSNTTYYYMVHTTDQDGNVTISWPSSFKTMN